MHDAYTHCILYICKLLLETQGCSTHTIFTRQGMEVTSARRAEGLGARGPADDNGHPKPVKINSSVAHGYNLLPWTTHHRQSPPTRHGTARQFSADVAVTRSQGTGA